MLIKLLHVSSTVPRRVHRSRKGIKKYGELTANTLKRKHAPETPSTIKQCTLMKTVKNSIDKAVVKYVVQGLQPFAVVEQEAFREFVQDLQPNSKISHTVLQD